MQEDFYPVYAYVKYVTLRTGHFWLQGYNLNELERDSQGNASFPISRL